MPQIIILSDSIGTPPVPPPDHFYLYVDTDDILKGINDNGKTFIFGGGDGDTGFLVGKETDTPFSVIQTAIDAANTAFALDGVPKVVSIRPGTYTEDLVLKEGVMLMGLNPGAAIPLSGSAVMSNGPSTKVIGELSTSSTSTHISNILFSSAGVDPVVSINVTTNTTLQFQQCWFLNDPANAVIDDLMSAQATDSALASSELFLGFQRCYINTTNVNFTGLGLIPVVSNAQGATVRAYLENSTWEDTTVNSTRSISSIGNHADSVAEVTVRSCRLSSFSMRVVDSAGAIGSFYNSFEDCEITPPTVGRFFEGSTQALTLTFLSINKTTFQTGSSTSALFSNYEFPTVGSTSKDSVFFNDISIQGGAWLPPFCGSAVSKPIYMKPGTFTIQQALDTVYTAFNSDGIQREIVLAPGLYEEADLTLYPMVTLRGEIPFDPGSVFSNQAMDGSNTLGWSSTSSGTLAQPLPNVAIIRNGDASAAKSFSIFSGSSTLASPVSPQSLDIHDILFLARCPNTAPTVGGPYLIQSASDPALAAGRLDVSFTNCGLGIMPVVGGSSYIPYFDISLSNTSSARFNNSAIGIIYASDVQSAFAANNTMIQYRREAVGSTGYLQFKDSLIQITAGTFFTQALVTESFATINGTLSLSARNSEFFGTVQLADPGSAGKQDFRGCFFQYDGNTANSSVSLSPLATAAHVIAPQTILDGCSVRQPELYGGSIFAVNVAKAVGPQPHKVAFSNVDLPVTLLNASLSAVVVPPGNQTILIDSTVSASELLLPDPNRGDLLAVNEKMTIVVKDIGGAAGPPTSNNIVIKSGVTTIHTINTNGGSVTLQYTNNASGIYWTVTSTT